MPIYEYACNACKIVFEKIISIHSDEKVVCEKCGSEDTRKLLSKTGLKVTAKSGISPGCQPRGGFS